MTAAIAFFLVGAGFGAFLAIRHFMRRAMSGWVAVAHGAAGATGFAILMMWCLRQPGFSPARYALGILVGAIGLGCVNIIYHLRRLRHRSALIVAHALVAVTGVGTLTYGALTYGDASAAENPRSAMQETPSRQEPAATAEAPSTEPRKTEPAIASPRPAEPARASLPTGPAWTDHAVRFGKDGATPDAASLAQIAAIAAALKADERIQLVEVQGHSDERGGEGQNLDLTRARAAAVVDALVEHGVAAARLRSAGFAARCPFDRTCERSGAPDACHGEAEWQKDRRVTFVVLEAAGERFQGPIACGRAADLISAEDAPYNKGASSGK